MFSLSPRKSLNLRGEFLYCYSSCSYQRTYSSTPSARGIKKGKVKTEN